MAQFSLDVTSLKIGAVAGDGGPGTTLASPGDVKENTIKVTSADSQKTPIKAAGKSAPVIIISQDGETTVEFDLMAFDADVMADLMGGTATGTAPNKVWNSPTKRPIIEKTIEVVDGQNTKWLLPRVQIEATLQGIFSTTDVNVIRVKGTVLQPTKTGVAAIQYGNPV